MQRNFTKFFADVYGSQGDQNAAYRLWSLQNSFHQYICGVFFFSRDYNKGLRNLCSTPQRNNYVVGGAQERFLQLPENLTQRGRIRLLQ